LSLFQGKKQEHDEKQRKVKGGGDARCEVGGVSLDGTDDELWLDRGRSAIRMVKSNPPQQQQGHNGEERVRRTLLIIRRNWENKRKTL